MQKMTCFAIENAHNSLMVKTEKYKKHRKIRENIIKMLIKTCNKNKESNNNVGKMRRKRTNELQDSNLNSKVFC